MNKAVPFGRLMDFGKSAGNAGERRIEMKFSTLTGLALAGAIAMGSASPALAQNVPFDPYYLTPKVLYSNMAMDDFVAKGSLGGEFAHHGNTGYYLGSNKSDGTFGGGLAIGYDFGAYTEYPIRVELEYLHRGDVKGSYGTKVTANHYGLMNNSATNVSSSSHKVSATVQTVMANFYLDFPTDSAFTPYVGLGVGGAYVDAKLSGYHNMLLGARDGYYYDGPNDTGPFNPDDYANVTGGPNTGYTHRYGGQIYGQQSCWNLAWQGSAGFSYQFKDNLALDVSYRYSDFGEVDFGSQGFRLHSKKIGNTYKPNNNAGTGGETGTNVNAVSSYSVKSNMDLKAHEVIVGLRITAW